MLRKLITCHQKCFSICSLSHQLAVLPVSTSGACFLSNTSYSKGLDLHLEKVSKTPSQPNDPKRLRVGVIGMPNAGKSTLINTLIGKHIMATSTRIDTTQDNVIGVLTEENVQIEFQDTPGIHNKRKAKRVTGKFRNSFLPQQCLESADMAMVVVDLSEKRTSSGFLSPEVLMHLMKFEHVPTILVLNKVDQLSQKTDVLPLISLLTGGIVDGTPVSHESAEKNLQPISLPEIKTTVFQALDTFQMYDSPNDAILANKTENKIIKLLRRCRGWSKFREVFVVSALKGHQTKALKTYLKSQAHSKPWRYHSKVESDLSPYDAVKNEIRSAMLDNLSEEVPYVTDVCITNWVESDENIEIYVDLVCPKVSHLRFLNRAIPLLVFSAKKRLVRILSTGIDLVIKPYTEREYMS